MGKAPQLSIDQRFEIVPPPQELVLLVPINTWQVYMDRIKNCSESSRFFDSFGWASVGFGLSALLLSATFPFSVEFVQNVAGVQSLNIPAVVTESACAVAALAGVIVGFVTLFYARRHSKDRAEVRSIIVEDMQSFSDRHLANRAPVAAAQLPINVPAA